MERTVLGTGRLILSPMEQKNWRYPNFHFLVFQENNGNFISLCLELLTEGSGDTVESSVNSLAQSTIKLLENLSVKPDRMFAALKEMVSDNALDELWLEYRLSKIKQSMKRNLSGEPLRKRVIQNVISTLPPNSGISFDGLEYSGRVA